MLSRDQSFDPFNEPVSMSIRTDSNLFQLFVAHLNQYIQGDLRTDIQTVQNAGSFGRQSYTDSLNDTFYNMKVCLFVHVLSTLQPKEPITPLHPPRHYRRQLLPTMWMLRIKPCTKSPAPFQSILKSKIENKSFIKLKKLEQNTLGHKHPFILIFILYFHTLFHTASPLQTALAWFLKDPCITVQLPQVESINPVSLYSF